MRSSQFTLMIACLLVPGCASKSGEEDAATPATTATKAGAPASVTPPSSGKPLPAEPVRLAAADGVEVFGDFYGVEQDKPRPLILLFHQAGSNAGEYAPIAPRLQALGYNALAIDQRSGAERWERKNRTVDALGKTTSYLEAYPDLEAALAWGKAQGYPRILAWGSSYSAALVFKLGAEHADDLHAILSFAPGEYIAGDDRAVSKWSGEVRLPIFVTSATGDEVEVAKTILAASPATEKTQYEPKNGVHGSSTLREDRNAAGMAENWAAVEAFLAKVAP